MRIIAGEFKGKKIAAPSGVAVRPTFDKVKEALFSIIMDDIYDATVLDLFAGSGNLGLEALSRGARKVYFCDKSGESLKYIKQNISNCKMEEYSVVLAGDFKTCINSLREKVDVIFLDPPYSENLMEQAMEAIAEADLLNDYGIICCETGKHDEMPEDISGFEMFKEKKYGNTMLKFYRHKES